MINPTLDVLLLRYIVLIVQLYWGELFERSFLPDICLQQPEEDEDGGEVAQDGGVTQPPSVAAERRAVEGRSSSEDDKNSDSTSSPTSPGELSAA